MKGCINRLRGNGMISKRSLLLVSCDLGVMRMSENSIVLAQPDELVISSVVEVNEERLSVVELEEPELQRME